MFGQSSWQEFEKKVGTLLELHDYWVETSKVVVGENTKRQYDVIARKNDKVILIDCKKWNHNRYKSSALKRAVKSQVERSEFHPGNNKFPVIVTWFDEDIQFHEGVPIVPIGRLNDFLIRMDELDLKVV